MFDGIDVSTLLGLPDQTLIGVMIYSFARVNAVTGMRRCGDYFSQGRCGWLWLHEKGGKRHDVPASHLAETYLDAYASPKTTKLYDRTADTISLDEIERIVI